MLSYCPQLPATNQTDNKKMQGSSTFLLGWLKTLYCRRCFSTVSQNCAETVATSLCMVVVLYRGLGLQITHRTWNNMFYISLHTVQSTQYLRSFKTWIYKQFPHLHIGLPLCFSHHVVHGAFADRTLHLCGPDSSQSIHNLIGLWRSGVTMMFCGVTSFIVFSMRL